MKKWEPIDVLMAILTTGYIIIVILLVTMKRELSMPVESAKLLADIIQHIPTLIGTYLGFKAGSQINKR